MVIGAVEVLLGLVFWTGHALALTKAAFWGGAAFSLLLWAISTLCFRAGSPRGLVIAGFTTGAAFVALGAAQVYVLPEPQSWLVRAAHVVLVLIGMGVSSELGATADLRRLDNPEQRTPPVTTSKA
jgi:ABC-type enterobactin transport system permease subunit